MYNTVINRLLALSKKYGGKTGHLQRVEFFFYADSEDQGTNLVIELSKLGYEVYGIEKSEKKWSVIGATPLMKIDEVTLTKWGEVMSKLADELDVLFDGWGMPIESSKNEPRSGDIGEEPNSK